MKVVMGFLLAGLAAVTFATSALAFEFVAKRSDAVPEGVGIRAHSGLGCTEYESGYYTLELPDASLESNVRKVLSFLEDGFTADCDRGAVFINEAITNSTIERFAALAVAIAKFSDDPLLILASPGGSISAAMAIGDIVADNFLSATIYYRDSCNSACVFIYAAAKRRIPLWPGSRQLGIHRPHDSQLSTESMTYSQYVARLEELTPLMKRYFAKYGVSPALVDAMNVVPSSEIRYLTNTEAENFGLGRVNIAFAEFDRAQTRQVCGDSYVQLERQFVQVQELCEARARNIDEELSCYDQATTIFPDFEERRDICKSKKRAARLPGHSESEQRADRWWRNLPGYRTSEP